MTTTATDPLTCQDEISAHRTPGPDNLVEATDAVLAEVLVEEISIDGMCGVY